MYTIDDRSFSLYFSRNEESRKTDSEADSRRCKVSRHSFQQGFPSSINPFKVGFITIDKQQ